MPITGQVCESTGVYRSLCSCKREVFLSTGDRCPVCDRHGEVTWRRAPEVTEPVDKRN